MLQFHLFRQRSPCYLVYCIRRRLIFTSFKGFIYSNCLKTVLLIYKSTLKELKNEFFDLFKTFQTLAKIVFCFLKSNLFEQLSNRTRIHGVRSTRTVRTPNLGVPRSQCVQSFGIPRDSYNATTKINFASYTFLLEPLDFTNSNRLWFLSVWKTHLISRNDL